MTERESQHDRLLDHEYDGIREYDNPMPRWWLYIFYASIVYSLLYFLNVPGIGPGKGRIAAYERDMAAAEAQRAKLEAAAPTMTAAQLVALSRDAQHVAAGKQVFTTNCVPCHAAGGAGLIGPNLTDDYWIHGGRPLEILHTVRTGVLAKGMPAWGPVLQPQQLTNVVAYVLTLHDTHPPNPKAPEGVKLEDEREGGNGSGGGE